MTKSEQKLFDIIVDFITKNKYPPTVRELCRLTGYRSTSTIQYKLKSLKEEGLIDFVANGKRTLKILTPSEDIVPVVRCKDCRYYKYTTISEQMECIRQTAYRKPDDFCSRGERKDNNE